jgi:DNA repair exonuclease SbcCD ATPase subunit
MSDHTIHTLDALKNRTRILEQRRLRCSIEREQLEQRSLSLQKEIEKLSMRLNTIVKVNELLRMLLDKMVFDQVGSIEKVVTEGLTTIFHDQCLALEAEVSTKYNKVSIDFVLAQIGKDIVKGEPLDSFGGGVSSVVSLLLRLLTMMKMKKYPILLLDETLAALSDEYIDAAGKLLRSLSEKTGLDILLITHKQAFLDHAHNSYHGQEEILEDGSRMIKLRAIKGTQK